MGSKARGFAAAAAALTLTLTALAKEASVDTAKSAITATFTQSGVPVDAPFTKFSGRIVYDPANASASSAAIDVSMASLDIGDEDYNEEVRKPSWFDSARHPTGSFRSSSVRPNGANKFDATGKLTIKGRAVTLTVPVTVVSVGGATAFDGAFNISRKAFAIGDPAWEGYVDDKVTVKFRLMQAQK